MSKIDSIEETLFEAVFEAFYPPLSEMDNKEGPSAAAAAMAAAAISAATATAAAVAVSPAATAAESEKEVLPKSTADTLCEVALKISSAALLINRSALIIKELASRESSGGKVVLPSGRSFSYSEERSTQTDRKPSI